MKKKFTLLLFPFIALSLDSCGSIPEIVYVKFFNYDGTILWQTEYYDGMILTYEGEEPTRPSDDVYNYSFSGWNHSFDEIKDYKNFYALYNKTIRRFTVTFQDYDGSLIKSFNVSYGENAALYIPDNPSRQNETRKHYYFSHWDCGDLTYVVSDMVCTAVYDEIDCYKVEYYDYNGDLLNTEYIEEGKDSNYSINSYHREDQDHFYIFDGWDANVENVHQDMTVNATYKIVNAYTVTFVNYDGSVLSSVQVPEGYKATYSGSTPFKESVISGKYRTDYIFKGWDKSLDNVHYSFFTTAQFKEDRYDYAYRNALNTVRSFCLQGKYELDIEKEHMVYENIISSGYTSSYMYEYVSIFYRPSDDFYYFHCSLRDYGSSTRSGLEAFIYMPMSEPGHYNVFYEYYYGSFDTAGLSFFGTTSFSSSFSQSTTSITFEQYTNVGGTSLSTNQQTCAGLINKTLTKAKGNEYFNMHALGFTNY